MDMIMAGPWMLSSQIALDHYSIGWAMDALFSERTRAWMFHGWPMDALCEHAFEDGRYQGWPMDAFSENA